MSCANVETSKSKHQYGSPLTIFGFEQDGDGTKVVVDYKTLDTIFLNPEVKNRKVVMVSIVGAFRKGKSFFLNYCLRFMYGNYKSVNFMSNPINDGANWMRGSDVPLTGFSWRSGVKRDTTGIILWSDVFLATNEDGEKLAIILMDTQGLFDSQTSPADNSKIFSLGTLISSLQILNLNDVIQENQLQYLQLATDFAKFASKDNQITTEPFQKLLFLIRDWCNPQEHSFGFQGGKSYLEEYLKVQNNQHETLKSVREYINSSFEDISCYLLPEPGSSVKNPDYDGNWSKMNESFKDELKILIETILNPKYLVIKKINNLELTAAEIKNYIVKYCNAFKSNENVGAQSIYEINVTEQLNNLIGKGIQIYQTIINGTHFSDIEEFVKRSDDVHCDSKRFAIVEFARAKKMGSEKHHLQFQRKLEIKIDRIFSDWKKDKTKNLEKMKAEIKKANEKARKKASATAKKTKEDKDKAEKDHKIELIVVGCAAVAVTLASLAVVGPEGTEAALAAAKAISSAILRNLH